MLGDYSTTGRGFAIVQFTDAYGDKCSLQQSSAIGDDDPGFIWLGVDDGHPQVLKSQATALGLELPTGEVSGWMPYPIPEEVVISTRMHLSRDQVAGLVDRLQAWIKTGDFVTEEQS
jgi:hypothetical protein